VYADLLSLLRPASMAQAEIMAANLALLRTGKNRIDVLTRFVWLKVSPDLDRGDSDKRRREIETELAAKYGSRLADVAGFYFMQDRWRLNLPFKCVMHGYAGRHGFYNGILCQPLDHINTYFLLSSAKFDGPKAIRLEERDRLFFESYNEPAANDETTAAQLRQNTAEAEINELISV
jgi:hypothetical protein